MFYMIQVTGNIHIYIVLFLLSLLHSQTSALSNLLEDYLFLVCDWPTPPAFLPLILYKPSTS
jgi:hypothetical protein